MDGVEENRMEHNTRNTTKQKNWLFHNYEAINFNVELNERAGFSNLIFEVTRVKTFN
jgi:hypothetical protein